MRERERRRTGVGARHIGDAVMHHAMLEKNGFRMGCGPRHGNTPPLIDTHIDNHGAWLHASNHFLHNHTRRLRAANEYGPPLRLGSAADGAATRGAMCRRCHEFFSLWRHPLCIRHVSSICGEYSRIGQVNCVPLPALPGGGFVRRCRGDMSWLTLTIVRTPPGI